MLVLGRKIPESIGIGGTIRVTMTSDRGQQVRIAIEAPADTPIDREQLIRPAPRAARTTEQALRRSARPPDTGR